MKKKIVLTAIILFVATGVIGGIFSTIIETQYPIILGLRVGIEVSIYYMILTIGFYFARKKFDRKYYIPFMNIAMCTILIGGLTVQITNKNTHTLPTFWMFIIIAIICIFTTWKATYDSKKLFKEMLEEREE